MGIAEFESSQARRVDRRPHGLVWHRLSPVILLCEGSQKRDAAPCVAAFVSRYSNLSYATPILSSVQLQAKCPGWPHMRWMFGVISSGSMEYPQGRIHFDISQTKVELRYLRHLPELLVCCSVAQVSQKPCLLQPVRTPLNLPVGRQRVKHDDHQTACTSGQY